MAAPVISGVSYSIYLFSTLLTGPQEELASFHASHFSSISTSHFSEHFLGPVEEVYAEEEDDGLGYYADGVKRTLTDEQIAIFRHSEIQTLLRERRHAREAKEHEDSQQVYTPGAEETEPIVEEPVNPTAEGTDNSMQPPKPQMEEGELADGELEDDSGTADMPPPSASKRPLSKKAKKLLKAKEKGFFKKNIKPDLRKRTWDKVDTGLESLDYEEGVDSNTAIPRPSQRRRISYDDD
jgi:hypothetical protein